MHDGDRHPSISNLWTSASLDAKLYPFLKIRIWWWEENGVGNSKEWKSGRGDRQLLVDDASVKENKESGGR